MQPTPAELTEVKGKIDRLCEIVHNLYLPILYGPFCDNKVNSTCEIGTQTCRTDTYSMHAAVQQNEITAVQSSYSELSADVEALKLDIVIVESKISREIQNNKQAIEQPQQELSVLKGGNIICNCKKQSNQSCVHPPERSLNLNSFNQALSSNFPEDQSAISTTPIEVYPEQITTTSNIEHAPQSLNLTDPNQCVSRSIESSVNLEENHTNNRIKYNAEIIDQTVVGSPACTYDSILNNQTLFDTALLSTRSDDVDDASEQASSIVENKFQQNLPLQIDNFSCSRNKNRQMQRSYFQERSRKRSRTRKCFRIRTPQERDRKNHYGQNSTNSCQNIQVPWFRYQIQSKDPDWIDHLDLCDD